MRKFCLFLIVIAGTFAASPTASACPGAFSGLGGGFTGPTISIKPAPMPPLPTVEDILFAMASIAAPSEVFQRSLLKVSWPPGIVDGE